MKLYVHKITVVFVGNQVTKFPIDMLRLDQLYPSSKEDSLKILRCFWKKGDRLIDKPIITLQRETWKTWTPTFERWKSFLWTVVKHEVV